MGLPWVSYLSGIVVFSTFPFLGIVVFSTFPFLGILPEWLSGVLLTLGILPEWLLGDRPRRLWVKGTTETLKSGGVSYFPVAWVIVIDTIIEGGERVGLTLGILPEWDCTI